MRRAARATTALVVVVAVGLPVGATVAAADEGQPQDSATAMANAQALRLEIESLQARVELAVGRYAAAREALDGSVQAELMEARRIDALDRAEAAERARSVRAVRSLYMIGGPGGLYAAVLDSRSLTSLLDGMAAVSAFVEGSLTASRAADALAAEADDARDRLDGTALTSQKRARVAAEAQAAAAEAQALETELEAKLAGADDTVQRLLAEEAARREAEQRAAWEAAARAAESAPNGRYLGGPKLSGLELVNVLQRAGFAGEALRVAWAVAMRESGGYPGAIGPYNTNGSRDHGLFQLNDIHLGRYIDPAAVNDPLANARAAYVMSRGGTDWSHWGLGDRGWAGHLMRDIPAVHARLYEIWRQWYDRFPTG